MTATITWPSVWTGYADETLNSTGTVGIRGWYSDELMTSAEARTLAATLLELADIAEQ